MRSLAIVVLFLGLQGSAGCLGAEGMTTSSTERGVVGGQLEDGYPAAGYMTSWESDEMPGEYANCGAALIAPSVAVTAGHCVVDFLDRQLAFGVGQVADRQITEVDEVWVHPQYHRDLPYPYRWRHDVALLVLDAPVEGVEPAVIGAADVDPGANDDIPGNCQTSGIYIGYGRTTVGDGDVEDGFTFERKSASQCISELDSYAVFAQGSDGGLCWGDSGGPLMRAGTNTLLGVLSDFDDGSFYCNYYNNMVFTNLAEHLDFICDQVPDAPSCCQEDGQCNPECDQDPDCGPVCDADGQCNPECDQDPDCAPACVEDGVCESGCPSDPDCLNDDSCAGPDCPDGGCSAGRGAGDLPGAILVVILIAAFRRRRPPSASTAA